MMLLARIPDGQGPPRDANEEIGKLIRRWKNGEVESHEVRLVHLVGPSIAG